MRDVRERYDLAAALDDIHEDLAFWIYYNDPVAKRALIHHYEALPERQRAALERAVEVVFAGHTLVAYRRMKPGDYLDRMGGMSLSTDRPTHAAFEVFELAPEDVLIHWAVTYPNGSPTPLGSRAYGHEHEVILRPDARPRHVGSGRAEMREHADVGRNAAHGSPSSWEGPWYHGSPERFERFQSRVGRTFGTGAAEVPIFLTRDPKFAALYAGPNGYVYEVRPHVEHTFDARAFILSDRYWPPEREALTPEGQKLHDDLVQNRIFPELIRYGTRHEDDDEWGAMHDSQGTYASIIGRDYDVMETTEMKRWLRAHGYDSFFVAGDGPNDNLAVFDPAKVEILSLKQG